MIYKTLQKKTKDCATRIPLKTTVELRCSGRVDSSCSIGAPVTNQQQTCCKQIGVAGTQKEFLQLGATFLQIL